MNPGTWFIVLSSCMIREKREVAASIGEIIVCMALPLVWMLMVWGLLGQGVMSRVPVGLVNEDQSPLSRELEHALEANRAFGLETYATLTGALAALRAGDIYGIALIPFAYARDQLSGRGSSMVLYLDENRYAVAGTLQAEMTALVTAVTDASLYTLALGVGAGSSGARRLVDVIHSDFYALGNMQFSFLAFLGGPSCQA